MKKIKKENIEVGDFIYIIENLSKEKERNRGFILNFLTSNEGVGNTKWWRLKKISKEISIFDPIEDEGYYTMLERIWEYYEVYKLNKKEIEKFKKLIILYNL